MAEDPSNPLSSIIGALQQKSSDRKGVVNNKGKVSANLTPEETARYKNIFGIMKDVVDPGPEAGKLNSSTQSKVGNTAAIQAAASGSKLKGNALAGLGLAGTLLGGALLSMVDDLQGKFDAVTDSIGTFVDDSGDEILKLPAMAAKVAKFLPIKSLKMLPFIGAFINFYDAGKHFDNDEYLSGAWEVISGLLNFAGPIGTTFSALMDGYKLYHEIMVNKNPVTGEDRPDSFENLLKGYAEKLGSFLYEKLSGGKIPILSELFIFGEGIGLMATNDWKGGFDKWYSILPNMFKVSIGSPLMNGLGIAAAISGQDSYQAKQAGEQMAGDAWGWLKEGLEKIGEKLGEFFNGIVSWYDNAIDEAKEFLFGNVPPMFKPDALKTKKEKGGGGTSSGTNFRLPGTIPGAQFFNAGLDALRFMNDGVISKDGQVTRFDDQDDILAAKSGGPVDKLLDGNSAVMQTIASINAQQLNVLVEIRDGIRALQSSGSSFADTSLTSQFYA